MGFMNRTMTVAGAVKASGGRVPLGQRLAAILPMLRDSFTGRWLEAPRGRLVAAVLGIAYVVSPIDLMPEALLGPFGLGDDIAIAAFSVAVLMSSAEAWLGRGSEQADQQSGPSASGQPGTSSAAGQGATGDVIEGIIINRRDS